MDCVASIPDGMALRYGVAFRRFHGRRLWWDKQMSRHFRFFQRLRPWVVVPDWEGVAADDW